jgi:hypothetical protein
MTTEKNYDGFHLLPNMKDDHVGLEFHFFSLDNKEGFENSHSKEPLVKNSFGELYNVLLMKQTEDGVEIDGVFSAIFADPVIYAENLLGTNIYGTFVKNNELCNVWWEHYVEETTKRIDSINENGELSDV